MSDITGQEPENKWETQRRITGGLPVRPESDGWKPSYDDLFKFFEHSLNLFVEGVEFMTKEEIYHSIKSECEKFSNEQDQRK